MMQNNKHATVINALLVDFCVKTIKKNLTSFMLHVDTH